MNLFFIPDTVGGRIKANSILLAGVPLLFTAIVLIFFVKGAIIKADQEELAKQAESHRIFIEEWIRERQNDVQFLAELDAVRNGREAEIKTAFHRFTKTHPDIAAVVMAGPDGMTAADSSGSVSVDISDREYFIKARAGESHVTKVIIGRTSGKAIIIFAHPITRQDGSFGGVVFLPSQLTAVNKLLENLHFGKTGETYILNREGDMLTESRYNDTLKEQGRIQDTAIMNIKLNSKVFTEALNGEQPDGPYKDYRGVEVLGASLWTKGGNWLIVSEIDYSEAMGQFYPFVWTIVGGFVVTLILLTPIIGRIARSIQHPLAQLSDMSSRMAWDEFDKTCSGTRLFETPREIRQLVAAFCSMQTQVDETVRKLEKSAVTDQLTGLPNRRYLMQEGARLVDIAIRAKQPCTLFMMDIDYFKDINDTYGHAVGDTVLRQMGETFKDIIRASDIVARYGGEEFALVAPGSTLESSQALAERIRHGVAAATFNTIEQPLACTISIGIAHYSSDIQYGVDAYEDMLARADDALYKAKAAGRNTVVVNGEDED